MLVSPSKMLSKLEIEDVEPSQVSPQVSLLEEQINPRANLLPLLVPLRDRRPERLHYLGVSFGLTYLFRFWIKHAPFYISQIPRALGRFDDIVIPLLLSSVLDPKISFPEVDSSAHSSYGFLKKLDRSKLASCQMGRPNYMEMLESSNRGEKKRKRKGKRNCTDIFTLPSPPSSYESRIIKSEGSIKVSKRSDVLKFLEGKLKKGNIISHETARIILGEKRFRFVKETKPKELHVFDVHNRISLVFTKEKLQDEFILLKQARNKLEAATGWIRDQCQHVLCWGYVVTDMISASLVLHGVVESYFPLCVRYLCQNMEGGKFFDEQPREQEGHGCYGFNPEDALQYLMKHGIPREDLGDEKFDCLLTRQLRPNEEVYKVKGYFSYPTLEEALVRLRTHPVGACVRLYDDYENSPIYRGPTNRSKELLPPHAVLIIDVKRIGRETVAICKNSHGKNTLHRFKGGKRGYLAVSLDVMTITVGAVDSDEDDRLHSEKPQYLLTNFFSVDMDDKINHKKDPKRKRDKKRNRDPKRNNKRNKKNRSHLVKWDIPITCRTQTSAYAANQNRHTRETHERPVKISN